MKIFTENNAFHNVGKCLDGTCMDVCQAGDALQMCVQVILYDKIEISPFVPREVINRTKEIKKILEREHGLHGVFDVHYPPSQETEVTRDAVIDIVKQTVNNSINSYFNDCEDFYVNYTNYHDNPLSLLPELGNKKARVERMTDLIKNRDKGPFIDAMAAVPRTEDGGITEIICQIDTLTDLN